MAGNVRITWNITEPDIRGKASFKVQFFKEYPHWKKFIDRTPVKLVVNRNPLATKTTNSDLVQESACVRPVFELEV
jgi:hypothetical protein